MENGKTGSCLCGAVHFEVRGPLREVVYCHCGQCRRQTGLYYASTNAADSDMTVQGGENVTWYKSSQNGRRGFCRQCGSALFWKYEGLDSVSIQAGTFDMPTRLVPGYHIFCEDKGDFYEITDDLPQYRKGRPGLVTDSD